LLDPNVTHNKYCRDFNAGKSYEEKGCMCGNETRLIPNDETMGRPKGTKPLYEGPLAHRNPTFKGILDQLLKLHDAKSHDYATDGNVYSNFEAAARFAHVTVDQVFEVLLGVKYARLWNLIQSGKTPNHESLDDTLIDIANYQIIRLAYRRDHIKDGK